MCFPAISIKTSLACLFGLMIAGSSLADAGTVVNYTDPTPTNVTPGTPIKVFLAAGQSNMRGRASISGLPAPLLAEQTDVLMVRGSTDRAGTTLDYLQPNYVADDGSTFGPELTFGRSMKDAYSDVNFAVIKYSKGGTGISQWRVADPTNPSDQGGSQYQLLSQTVANGLQELTNAGYAPEIIGMLWHQGESNIGSSNYETLLNDFISGIRGEYGENLPFLIGEIATKETVKPGADGVRAAQAAVAANDPYASLVAAKDLAITDTHHFGTPGMITLGERFAASYQQNFSSNIPEPGSLSLLALGGLMLMRRRHSR